MLKLSSFLKKICILAILCCIVTGLVLTNYVDFVIKSESNVKGGSACYTYYLVNITLLNDGSLNISELWVVRLHAEEGEFKFGYRIIPIFGFDDIVDVQVYEIINHILIPLKTEVIKAFGKIGIKFYFNPVKNSVKIFFLNYIVKNALWEDKLRNYLRWIIFPEKHPEILNGEFNVIIPWNVNISFNVDPDYIVVSTLKKGNVTIIHAHEIYLGAKDTVKLEISFPKKVDVNLSLLKLLMLVLQKDGHRGHYLDIM